MGGLCFSEARTCDFRLNASQENWFFTQFIRYINASDVLVNISVTFAECINDPDCDKPYFELYRYETNGRDDTAARNVSNYQQLLQRIEQPSGFRGLGYETTFAFSHSGSFIGFYLGGLGTGTCVNIQRIQIYYRILPQRNVGLVTYPEIGLPTPNRFTSSFAICATNSEATSSLQLICYSDGTCAGNPSCSCLGGYQEVPLQNGVTECRGMMQSCVATPGKKSM